LPAWNAGIITAQCRSTETMAKAPLWHSETGPLHGPVRRAPGRPMVQARGVDFWFRSDGQGMENPVYRQSLLLQGTLPMYSISWSLSLSASANRAAGHLRKPPTSALGRRIAYATSTDRTIWQISARRSEQALPRCDQRAVQY
jgi:hypothetical protein